MCDPTSDMKWRIANVLLETQMPKMVTPYDEASINHAMERATRILEAMLEPTDLMKEAAGYDVGFYAWYPMIECAIHGSATWWRKKDADDE